MKHYNTSIYSTIIIFLFCCVSESSAKIIRAQEITATTDMSAIHHRGYQASSIEQITDGIMSDTPPYGGFIARAQSGIIHLTLDKVSDLKSFYLWNDIENRAGHGIKEFSLEFFDADNRSITRISQSKTNGKFMASMYHIKSEKFQFDTTINDVKRVDLIIHSSYKDEIRIREVAFANNETDDNVNKVKCSSPWTTQNLLEHSDIILHENDYMWSLDYKGFFNDKTIQFLHDNTTENITADTFKKIISYSLQGMNNLPIQKTIKDSWLEVWDKNALTPNPSSGYIVKYNQWVKYTSTVSVLNEDGRNLALFTHDDCVNALVYFRIKTTKTPEVLELQISDGKRIIKTTIFHRAKETQVSQTIAKPFSDTSDEKKISLIKDSGDLTFIQKEFNADLLEWPLTLDYVLHAKFDDTRANRALLHTFNFQIPKTCQIKIAFFEVKIKNLGQQYNNDVLWFFDNGSSLKGMKLWQGDELNNESKTLKLNLSGFKVNDYLPLQNILHTLDDGDLSIAIQDDTSVDYVKLDIILSGDECFVDKP